MVNLIPPLPTLPTSLPINIFQKQAMNLLITGGTANFTNPLAGPLGSVQNLIPNLRNRLINQTNLSSFTSLPTTIQTNINSAITSLSPTSTTVLGLATFLTHTNITSGAVLPGSNSILPSFAARMGLANSATKLDATQGADNVCGAVGELFATLQEGLEFIHNIENKINNMINQGLNYIISNINNVMNYVQEQITALQNLITKEIAAIENYTKKLINAALSQALEDLLNNSCTSLLVKSVTKPEVTDLLDKSRGLQDDHSSSSGDTNNISSGNGSIDSH